MRDKQNMAKGNKLTKIFRKPNIWESDGKLLMDDKKSATCHKIHHRREGRGVQTITEAPLPYPKKSTAKVHFWE